LELEEFGLDLVAHRLPEIVDANDYLQYFVWGAAILMALSSFVRYQRRDGPTWFSKSIPFHLSRVALFDLFLAYMVLSLVAIWLDFSVALHNLLGDPQQVFGFFAPDLMYGLRPAYSVVTGVSFLLVVLSFMPAVMLLRERRQAYGWIYYGLIYGAVIAVAVLFGFLIFRFNGRIENIHFNALQDVLARIDRPLDVSVPANETYQVLVALEYTNVVRWLPDGFPLPRWLEYILGARLLLLTYELYIIFSPKSEWPTLSEALRRVTKTLS
jgi:hypothetical protein